MLTSSSIKIIGIGLSLFGTMILAIRVTKILSALTLAVRAHEINFMAQVERARGNMSVPNIRIVGNDTHIEHAEKTGTKLLILGFFLQIAGGVCHAAALWLDQ